MLSILSGTSPFFLSNRDVDGLIEIANVCGITRVSALAKFYGKVCSVLVQVLGMHTNLSSCMRWLRHPIMPLMK
jgi:hypothetical protein